MLVVFKLILRISRGHEPIFSLICVKCVQLMCIPNPTIHDEYVPISLPGCKYNAVNNSKEK